MSQISAKYEEFESVFDQLVEDIKIEPILAKSDSARLFRSLEVFRYNVHNRSDRRGFIVSQVYCSIMKDRITKEKLHLAYVLGWLAQTLTAVSFMLDDYLDNDMIRWGKPTWYAKQGRSKYTIVDTLNLESVVYFLLKKYFYHHQIYNDLVHFFQEMRFGFCLGQTMEEFGSFKNDPDMTYYTVDNYKTRITLTSLKNYFNYFFHLPMILAGLPTSGKLWDDVEAFTFPLLYYCSLRNDLHDSFHTYQDMKKVPADRDIRMGLNKYLIITAKNLCTQDQLKILKESYGVDDEKNAEIVKKIYCDLGIPNLVDKELDILKAEIEKKLLEKKINHHVFAEMFEHVKETFMACTDI